jgi:flagellar hook assembly protein FlgD
MSNNLVDAVTAATMHSHGARTATWNGTNTSRALVADGAYKVCFELEDGSSQYQCVDFSKSRSAQTVMPSNTTSFTARTITYTP